MVQFCILVLCARKLQYTSLFLCGVCERGNPSLSEVLGFPRRAELRSGLDLCCRSVDKVRCNRFINEIRSFAKGSSNSSRGRKKIRINQARPGYEEMPSPANLSIIREVVRLRALEYVDDL